MSKTKEITAFAMGDSLPAHLQSGSGLGNENLGANDVKIAHLDLIQQLSPQLLKSSPKYIEGAELGDIFNSLSGEVYKSVFLVNLKYDLQFSLFKKRKLGGGLEGNFTNPADAHAHMEAQNLEASQYDIVETGVHTCLMLDETGAPKRPVMLYMNSSKKAISDAWNSNILEEGKGADRFATVWVATSKQEVNKQNQPYQNWSVKFAGFADENLYGEAKKTYFAMKGEPVPTAH